MSFFDAVLLAPPDPILSLTTAYRADQRPCKVNLGAGLYKGEDLKTPVLKSVKAAEKMLLQEEKSKEYLPIEGDPLFIDRIGELIFGTSLWAKEQARISGFQAIGGTGALSIGGLFLREVTTGNVYISDPSWANHRGIFLSTHFHVENYPYYDRVQHGVCYEPLLFFLRSLARGSVIVFHTACHNPTGADLTLEQWKDIAEICVERELFPFFDTAYQGFGRSLEEDVLPIRLFLEKGLEMAVASSQSKNFSLYGERVGALFIVTDSLKQAALVTSRVKQIIRTHYSNPSIHGTQIVARILTDPSLRKSWEGELTCMRERIYQMRFQLSEGLARAVQRVDLRYLNEGFGMFCFCNLSKSQVDRLIAQYGIYMPSDGRINVCGLNGDNLDYVVSSIKAIYA